MSDGIKFFQQIGSAERIAVLGWTMIGEWDVNGVCWVLTDESARDVHLNWSYREWMDACRAAAVALSAEP